jgi:hypothetical protein
MKHSWLALMGLIAGCGTTPNGDIYGRPWRFTAESASIDTTQSNGAAWDPDNSPPDAFVHMYIATFDDLGTETDLDVGTSSEDESYVPSWDFSGATAVFAGDTLSIEVIDSDTFDDDPIVSCDVDLTRAVADTGEASCSNDQADVHIGVDVE